MADAARFDINIEASSLGVDATSAQLNSLVDRLKASNTVATQFDQVVAAARARLDEASAAASAAASALGQAEGRYKELESAANRAAKQVEKAATAGKDTTALRAAAAEAEAAMNAQAAVVDELRVKSDAAAKSQRKLADTMKTLEGQQSAAAAAFRKARPAAKSFDEAASAAAAPAKAEGLSMIGMAAAAGAAAFVGLAGAALAGAQSMLKFAFAIPQNAMMMQRLTMAQQRMQIGMQRLFTGLKWDRFTRGLEDVMTLFDEGTSSAKGMKLLIETVFQPLLDGAAKAAPFVKEMFKGMIYGALQVVIAVLKIRNEIFKAMSPETRKAIKDVIDSVVTLENAFKLGETTAKVLAGAMAVLGVAFAIGSIPVMMVVVSIQRVIEVCEWLGEQFTDTVDAITDFAKDAGKAAAEIITGIVTSIVKGYGAVVEAMKNLGKKGVAAFKETLGIASPSKVFALQAQYTVDGYVQGIEGGTPEVEGALESMATPPELAAPAAAAVAPTTTSTTTSSSTRSVVIQQLTVGGGSVAQDNWSQLRAMLVDLVGDGNLQIGGGEAPAT